MSKNKAVIYGIPVRRKPPPKMALLPSPSQMMASLLPMPEREEWIKENKANCFFLRRAYPRLAYHVEKTLRGYWKADFAEYVSGSATNPICRSRPDFDFDGFSTESELHQYCADLGGHLAINPQYRNE